MKHTLEIKNWKNVYTLFMRIADETLDQYDDHDIAHQIISEKVDALYTPHKGDLVWDIAYNKWMEV